MLTPQETVIKLPVVSSMTGKPRSSIYKGMADETFPRQIKLGKRSVGWKLSEIQNWISTRPTTETL